MTQILQGPKVWENKEKGKARSWSKDIKLSSCKDFHQITADKNYRKTGVNRRPNKFVSLSMKMAKY